MRKKWFFISWIPLGATLLVLPFFPDKVPMHYGLSGNIDRYGAKWELLILPLMIILITLGWELYVDYCISRSQNHRYESVRQEATVNAKNGHVAKLAMFFLFSCMHVYFIVLAYLYSDASYMGASIDINRVTTLLTGIFIAGVGYFSAPSKHNPILIATGILIAMLGALIGGVTSLVLMLFILTLSGIISIIIQFKKS